MLKLNTDNPTLVILEPTFNAILDRFIEEGRQLEIEQQRPGDRSEVEGELSYSTAVSYLSAIQQVRVQWGTTHITRDEAAEGAKLAEGGGFRAED